MLKVSRAAYHHWSVYPLSMRARADIVPTERVTAIHARSRHTYGAPRIHAELQACGELHSRKRMARLMRGAGIAGRFPRRYQRTTIGDPFTVVPDLVQRDFAPTRPDELWVADITHVRTWEGWLYLAAILDCYSRRSLAGRWPITCAPSCRSTRCTWPWRVGFLPIRSSTTPTAAASTPPRRTPTCSKAMAFVQPQPTRKPLGQRGG